MKMKNRIWKFICLGAVLVLAGCGVSAAETALPSENPVNSSSGSTPNPFPSTTEDWGDLQVGENAQLEEISVNVMESFPLQVSVTLRGSLPDGCTKVLETTAEREGEVFTIKILTGRPADAVCTQALVPFEETLALDVIGLPAGTYTVKAYGKTAEFTFSVDNRLED